MKLFTGKPAFTTGKKLKKNYWIFILPLICYNCFIENEYDYPLVLTGAVTNISGEGAHFHGKISYLGDKDLLDHGFVWDTTSNPDISSAYVYSMGPAESEGFYEKKIIASLEAGKFYKVRAFVKTENVIVYGQEVEFVSLGCRAPAIDSISPATGVWGDTLTISGSAYGYKQEEIEIYFDSLKTSPLENTDTTLRVIVPYDVGVSPVDIFVEVLGNRTHSPGLFSFLPPIVDEFTPKEGYYNVPVTITGDNFHPDFTIVFFNDISVSILDISDTLIVVNTPQGLPKGEVTISVSVAGQTITVNEKFTSLRHSLDAFEPTQGTFGDEIVISGEDFSVPRDSISVFFGDTPAVIASASENQISVEVPDDLLNRQSYIRVMIHDETVSFAEPFVLFSPEISEFSPLSGTFNTDIHINGNYFHPDPSVNIVEFNGSRAAVLAGNRNELSVALPNSCTTADGSVTVRVRYGDLTAEAEEYFQLDMHSITSISPTNFERGDTLRISGMNFNPEYQFNKLLIGEHQADILSASTGELVCLFTKLIDHGTYTVSMETGGRMVEAAEKLHVFEPWKRLADYAGIPSRYALGFSVDDKGYLADGGGIASYLEFWEYDIAGDSWSEKNTLPMDPTISFTISDTAYIGSMDEYYKYNQVTDSWSPIPVFAGDIYWGPAVFSIDDKAYLVGGHHNTGYQYDKVWAYDASHNHWEEKTPFPGGAVTGCFGFSIDGTGYLGIRDSKDFLSYDPASDSWSKRQDLIDTGESGMRAMVINGKAYVLSNESPVAYEYDPQADQWKIIPGLPSPRPRSAVFTTGSFGYTGTGGEFNEPSTDFYRFDPTKIKPD